MEKKRNRYLLKIPHRPSQLIVSQSDYGLMLAIAKRLKLYRAKILMQTPDEKLPKVSVYERDSEMKIAELEYIGEHVARPSRKRKLD